VLRSGGSKPPGAYAWAMVMSIPPPSDGSLGAAAAPQSFPPIHGFRGGSNLDRADGRSSARHGRMVGHAGAWSPSTGEVGNERKRPGRTSGPQMMAKSWLRKTGALASSGGRAAERKDPEHSRLRSGL